MKQINLIILVLIVLTAMSLPFTNAQYKPVAGVLEIPVDLEPLEIKLYVEINSSLVGNDICIINPTVQNAPDGSFSTDLTNLVLRDFPSVRCGSFWKQEDPIWYEANFDDKTYISSMETIASGTGLQWLKPLVVPIDDESTPLPSDSGSNFGGGVGGGKDSTLQLPTEEAISEGSSTIPEILTQLLTKQEDNSIEAVLTMELLNNVKSDILVKLVLFSLPNNQITDVIESNFFIKSKIKEEYQINTINFNPGRYKLQAFIYAQNELIAVSNIEPFFIGGIQAENLVEESIVGKAIQESREVVASNSLIYIFALIIVLLLFILWIKKQKEKKKPTMKK